MASREKKSKVLVIGPLQHIAKFIAIASVKLGHPTLALLPCFHSADPDKNEIINSFKEQGVTLFKGDIENHSRLVQAIRAVDVVIWAAERVNSILMDCTMIIAAIKEADNITRFIPLVLPVDVDRINVEYALQPAAMTIVNCREMMRFVEQSGVPYTYVVANFFAGIFVGRLNGQQSRLSPPLKIPLFGNGNTKGTYTILGADDPRTLFKTLYIRPPENVISLNELVSLWESKINRLWESKINRFWESIYFCQRTYFSEEALLKKYHEAQPQEKFVIGFMHSAFIRGDQTNYEIDPSFGLEASQLYPHVEYTTMNEYLNRFLPE